MKDQPKAIGTRAYEAHPLESLCAAIVGQPPNVQTCNDAGRGLPFYHAKKEFTDRFSAPPTTWTAQDTKRTEPNDILMSVRAPVEPIIETKDTTCSGRAAIGAGIGKGKRLSFCFCPLFRRGGIGGDPVAIHLRQGDVEITNRDVNRASDGQTDYDMVGQVPALPGLDLRAAVDAQDFHSEDHPPSTGIFTPRM